MHSRNQKSFRTVIKPISYDFKISHNSEIVLLGSCFTENIGLKLERFKFNTDNNPFGILYNPISILNGLNILHDKRVFKEDDLFFHNEMWHSFYHHSRFSGSDKSLVSEEINNRIESSSIQLKKTDFLFITFGTSWVYEFIETNQIVSNCHKVPNKKFRKYLMNLSELTEKYLNMFNDLLTVNPKLKIIFTVSPVRHLKDGFTENFLSKSMLRVLIDNIMKEMSSVYYFPAFEILFDDLRDYRFYNEDMLHPNSEAVNYVFEYFSSCFLNQDTIQINEKINKILKSIEHRAINDKSEEYKRFVRKNINEIQMLAKTCPAIDLDEELNYFLR